MCIYIYIYICIYTLPIAIAVAFAFKDNELEQEALLIDAELARSGRLISKAGHQRTAQTTWQSIGDRQQTICIYIYTYVYIYTHVLV